mgnify:CR=1 FL=1
MKKRYHQKGASGSLVHDILKQKSTQSQRHHNKQMGEFFKLGSHE